MASRVSKRLLIDLQAAQNPELIAQGIFYHSDEADCRKGTALIRGNAGTPYEGFLGMFDFVFPNDYPFSPPQVIWKTYDGTRFHPQLYVGGKVCLSILGTWQGPGWTSSLNLVSILLVLQSLFVENPLSCEPGYEKGTLTDPQYKTFRDIVEYKCCDYMIRQMLSWKQKKETHIWAPFQEELDAVLPSLLNVLKTKIDERAPTGKVDCSHLPVFGFHTFSSNWLGLQNLLPKLESPT